MSIELAPVVTVQPKAKVRHTHITSAPSVIELLKAFQIKLLLAPSVTDHVGVHQTLPADAPFVNITLILAAAVSAQVILKIYVPLPLKVIPVVIDAAAAIQ